MKERIILYLYLHLGIDEVCVNDEIECNRTEDCVKQVDKSARQSYVRIIKERLGK